MTNHSVYYHKPKSKADDGYRGDIPPPSVGRDKLLRALREHHDLDDVKNVDVRMKGRVKQ